MIKLAGWKGLLRRRKFIGLFLAWGKRKLWAQLVLLLLCLNCWEVVKADLLMDFVEIFNDGKIGIHMNSTFITLDPKKDSVHKIIAKVLTSRLSQIISYTISENQCAFILGRKILDAAHS